MRLFGGGATLAGLILGAIAAFIIDRRFDRAAMYALIGAVLAFFGFINGTALGIRKLVVGGAWVSAPGVDLLRTYAPSGGGRGTDWGGCL